MKKYIIIATAAIVASFGVTYAASALRGIEDSSKPGIGQRCNMCNGTGWRGQSKCIHCRGTGANSAY